MTGVVSQDQEEQAYFAVFDGHGGVDAAIYAANHLHVNLVHQESFSQDPSEALCRAFKLTDEGFVKKASREVNTPAKSPNHSETLTLWTVMRSVNISAYSHICSQQLAICYCSEIIL